MKTPRHCSECGGALLVVITRVQDGRATGPQKQVHYRCQDLACAAHLEDVG